MEIFIGQSFGTNVAMAQGIFFIPFNFVNISICGSDYQTTHSLAKITGSVM
jgi:hypothetical protein